MAECFAEIVAAFARGKDLSAADESLARYFFYRGYREALDGMQHDLADRINHAKQCDARNATEAYNARQAAKAGVGFDPHCSPPTVNPVA